MKASILFGLLLISCTKPVTFEQRLQKAAQAYCAKLELCTKAKYDSCTDAIRPESVPEAEREQQLQALIDFTEQVTCNDLLRLVDDLR